MGFSGEIYKLIEDPAITYCKDGMSNGDVKMRFHFMEIIDSWRNNYYNAGTFPPDNPLF
jgi:hypothetical protein